MDDRAKETRNGRAAAKAKEVEAELIAVVVAVNDGEPVALTIGQADCLPSGPFALEHRSLQAGLRTWVEQQTGHPLGYIEQLYTFADRDRIDDGRQQRVISISYLALTRKEHATGVSACAWQSWYEYFPWEDHRFGTPKVIADVLKPRLLAWAADAEEAATRRERRRRAVIAFGFEDRTWNEELALQRYELLYEAGLVTEATRDGRSIASASTAGTQMIADHRRILATGIARLRSKIKYRPVVFELMPPAFTLLQLQRAVEALAGRLINKPNFRRLIEQQELVEETGKTSLDTGGRPAKLYQFRHAVLDETSVAGTKLPLARG
ncbi:MULTISPECIES: NUDIX hydrolase [unclassified Mesorhizobium]|uniref:NUDIX hydrolase n=1 Tax=unclassified Mesorhizobium TaxID=325217 RepID=UPI000463A2D9|nr:MULTISPECIES: membrane protein [unclassified Mesorhizobium]